MQLHSVVEIEVVAVAFVLVVLTMHRVKVASLIRWPIEQGLNFLLHKAKLAGGLHDDIVGGVVRIDQKLGLAISFLFILRRLLLFLFH